MDIVGGGAPETLQTAGGWLWGSAIGEAQWPIGPQMMGPGMPPLSDFAGYRRRGQMSAQNSGQQIVMSCAKQTLDRITFCRIL